MSEREELLKAFWDAAEDPEFVGYVYDYSAKKNEGEDVRIDGSFNIWAGIQAVIRFHDLWKLGSASEFPISTRQCDECQGWASRSFEVSVSEHHARACSRYSSLDALDAEIEALKAENAALKAAMSDRQS